MNLCILTNEFIHIDQMNVCNAKCICPPCKIDLSLSKMYLPRKMKFV